METDKIKEKMKTSIEETSKGEIVNLQNIISNMIYDGIINNNRYMNESSIENTKKAQITLFQNNGNIEFISIDKNSLKPYLNIMSEEEFFKVIGKTKKGISKRSGRYQEKLYGFYLKAVKENDIGFIEDVLNKAVVFRNNLNYIKKLENNKKFMKEWKKDFGIIKPTNHFKNSGKLRAINIINERIKF